VTVGEMYRLITGDVQVLFVCVCMSQVTRGEHLYSTYVVYIDRMEKYLSCQSGGQ
jgi:hypothetical protein